MSGVAASSSPAKSFSTPACRQPPVRDCQLQVQLVTDRNEDEELVALVVDLTVVVVAQPNTKLPIADYLRVDCVDIDEIPLEQESELKEAGSGQDAASNEWSLSCNATTSGNGTTSHGSTVTRSKPLQTVPRTIASTSDTQTPGSRIPSRFRINRTDKTSSEEVLQPRSEFSNSTSLPSGMTDTLAGPCEPNSSLDWNRNSTGDNTLWDPSLARNRRAEFLRDPISRPEYTCTNLSSMLDGTNDYSGIEESAPSQEPLWKIPLRQREPSAETANISLPPVLSSEWGNDDSSVSPENPSGYSPAPESTSLLQAPKTREQNNGKSPNGSQKTPQSTPKKDLTQQADDTVETHANEVLKTPGEATSCPWGVSPSHLVCQTSTTGNFRQNTSKDDGTLSSKSGSALNLTPRAQTEDSMPRSPKRETVSTPRGTPRKTESDVKDKTPPSKDLGAKTQESPLEGFSIQQFESSPTPSQAQRTDFVRSWIRGAQSRETMGETFSLGPICSPTQTHRSSTVGDDARVFELDGHSENDDDQKYSAGKTDGDLVSLATSSPTTSEFFHLKSPPAHPERNKPCEYRARDAITGSYFSTVEVRPYTQELNGSMAIVFPGNVINRLFKIRILATSDFNNYDDEGCREFTLPGFEAQDGGDRGSLLFNFAKDPSFFEFDTQALSWAEIDRGSLYAEFELSRGVALPVRLLDTSTHVLFDGFTINNTIRSTHNRGTGTNCLAIEYTATCTLDVTRQNFWAEMCCFYITLEGGPWGCFEYSLDEHDWHVQLDSAPRFSAGDTEIKITCPFSDIGKPFRISWRIDVKDLPEKSWVPQIRPLYSDVRESKTAWSESFGMPCRGHTSIAGVNEDISDPRVRKPPNGVGKAADDQDGTFDHQSNNPEIPNNDGRDGHDSVMIECGEDLFGGVDKYGRRVRPGQSESDTSSEFIDHPSPWIERDFGMITFLIPLLLLIVGLLRKIIGRKISHISHRLRQGFRRISMRTWLKFASLVYLGSLLMGANPIQRFDEFVHRLAVVEKQATIGLVLPLLGREDGTIMREQRGLFVVRSSLEDFLQVIDGPKTESPIEGAQKCLSVIVQADELGRKPGWHANKNTDMPAEYQNRDKKQNYGPEITADSKSERNISPATLSHDTTMVSVPTTEPAISQSQQKPQSTTPSMRDRIDYFLGWRDPDEL